MIFCRGCGKELHISAIACPQCGATQGNQKPAKSKVTSAVLAFMLGGLGIHKFYLGSWGWGIIYILFIWTYIPSLVALVEAIRYLVLSDEEFSKKSSELNGPFAFLW